MIARLPDCLRRKLGVRGFELLKADNVGLGFAEPVHEVRQATVDIVDIEAGDLHLLRQRNTTLRLFAGISVTVGTENPTDCAIAVLFSAKEGRRHDRTHDPRNAKNSP
jgi:hypothetical protein